MNKFIDIKLIDHDLEDVFEEGYGNEFIRLDKERTPRLYYCDVRNIINKFGDRKISWEEMTDALDLITSYFYQEGLCKLVLDIDDRNFQLEPAKEMTLKDIEKKLGYKVKIVSEKEK